MLGSTAFLLNILLVAAGAIDSLERQTWDWRIRTWGAPAPSTSQITTIMIDQTSLDEAEALFGVSWIWPRQIYAYILSFCQRAEAKAVVFDLLFTESSGYGVEDDLLFAEAISNAPPFVAALPMGIQTGTSRNWIQTGTKVLPKPGRTPTRIHTAQTASFPVPPIARSMTLPGAVIANPDSDAVFRRIAPFQVFDQHWVPSLGIAAFLAAHPSPLPITYTSDQQLSIADRTIPLDRNGMAILNFRGPTQTHKALNATAILQSELQIREGRIPQIDPAILRDQYVILGLTAPGLMDLKPTPVGQTYPGLEVHATVLDNLLNNDFIRPAPFLLTSLLSLIAALAAAMTVRLSGKAWVSALAIPFWIALPVPASIMAFQHNIWLPLVPIQSAGLIAVLGTLILNYALEGHQKRFLKNAFRQYLSPKVIDRLIQDPNALTLGGEEKELSIYFSDVQGFTSISESLTPTTLTQLLNEYLTAMTAIIHHHGGTIDKYEGDAIIAFWNAPLALPDHATAAVKAALEGQLKLAALRDDFKTRFGCDMQVRIGINTGPVVVGNMGSTQRFDYTFLGDAGNLASRLEGINKVFNTRVLIAENTQQQLSPEIFTRQIARVCVVGKAIPVAIYEPSLTPFPDTPTQAFQTARELYEQGDFQHAREAFALLAKDDPVSRAYAQECARLQQDPPDSWDGVWAMTSK